MITFAVWHEGLAEGQGRWVLAVDDDRVLLSEDDGSLYYRTLQECKVVRAATPDQPLMVVPVQVNQQPQIVTPPMMPNRMMRRHPDN